MIRGVTSPDCRLPHTGGLSPVGCQAECELLSTRLPLFHPLPTCGWTLQSPAPPLPPQSCSGHTAAQFLVKAAAGLGALDHGAPLTNLQADYLSPICPSSEPFHVVITSLKTPTPLSLLHTWKIISLLISQRIEVRTASPVSYTLTFSCSSNFPSGSLPCPRRAMTHTPSQGLHPTSLVTSGLEGANEKYPGHVNC